MGLDHDKSIIAWQGKARHGLARQGLARHGLARLGEARHGMVLRGEQFFVRLAFFFDLMSQRAHLIIK